MILTLINDIAPYIGFGVMGAFAGYCFLYAFFWIRDTLEQNRADADINLRINLLRERASFHFMEDIVEVCDYIQRKGNWSPDKGLFGPTPVVSHIMKWRKEHGLEEE